jgi:uncharacterized membrane protein
MDTFNRFVTQPTAALAAITGGVLFGFSTLVMPALRRVPPPVGIRSMQQINLVAPRSLLMVPLIGSTLGSVVIATWALGHRDASRVGWLWMGAAAGVASFVVTAAFNIPQNNLLAHMDPEAVTSTHTWLRYVSHWSTANHARTLLSLVSAGALVVATRSP